MSNDNLPPELMAVMRAQRAEAAGEKLISTFGAELNEGGEVAVDAMLGSLTATVAVYRAFGAPREKMTALFEGILEEVYDQATEQE